MTRLHRPALPNHAVVSTEAIDSPIVHCAAERPPHFVFALAAFAPEIGPGFGPDILRHKAGRRFSRWDVQDFAKASSLLVLAISLSGCEFYSRKVLASVPSPDGKLVANVVLFDPGAMGGTFSQVYVHLTTDKDEIDNRMLAVDANCPVEVNWTNNKALRAVYDCTPSAIEIAVFKENGITMEFVEKPLPPIQSTFVP
jgi:hypothetical protein